MEYPKIEILNTTIHNLSFDETLAIIEKRITERVPTHHVVVNAAKIVQLQNDAYLREGIRTSDIINADGQAVVWASKILGKPLKERVAGIDIMEGLIARASSHNFSIYFLGAKEDVVKKVVHLYSGKYGGDIVAGYRNGYFSPDDVLSIAQDIATSGADMLFVAIPSPYKENFLYDNRETLKAVPFIMGVGGSFDVVAQVTKRAPKWMQSSGLEWFYRLIQEPKRMWKRYLVGNTKFILLVIQALVRKNG